MFLTEANLPYSRKFVSLRRPRPQFDHLSVASACLVFPSILILSCIEILKLVDKSFKYSPNIFSKYVNKTIKGVTVLCKRSVISNLKVSLLSVPTKY